MRLRAMRVERTGVSDVHHEEALSRRTFLQGAGATWRLPLLESMIPARTLLAQTAANPAPRLGFVYVPHGAVMAQWTPATEGGGFEFPRDSEAPGAVPRTVECRQRSRTQGGRYHRGALAESDDLAERHAAKADAGYRRLCRRHRGPDRRRSRSARGRCCRRSSLPPKTIPA